MCGQPDTPAATLFACHPGLDPRSICPPVFSMDPGSEAGVTNENVAIVRVGASNAINPLMDALT